MADSNKCSCPDVPEFKLAEILAIIAGLMLATSGIFFSASSNNIDISSNAISICKDKEYTRYFNQSDEGHLCWDEVLSHYQRPLDRYNILFQLLAVLGLLLMINSFIFLLKAVKKINNQKTSPTDEYFIAKIIVSDLIMIILFIFIKPLISPAIDILLKYTSSIKF